MEISVLILVHRMTAELLWRDTTLTTEQIRKKQIRNLNLGHLQKLV